MSEPETQKTTARELLQHLESDLAEAVAALHSLEGLPLDLSTYSAMIRSAARLERQRQRLLL